MAATALAAHMVVCLAVSGAAEANTPIKASMACKETVADRLADTQWLTMLMAQAAWPATELVQAVIALARVPTARECTERMVCAALKIRADTDIMPPVLERCSARTLHMEVLSVVNMPAVAQAAIKPYKVLQFTYSNLIRRIMA
jgi:hypothetical protein